MKKVKVRLKSFFLVLFLIVTIVTSDFFAIKAKSAQLLPTIISAIEYIATAAPALPTVMATLGGIGLSFAAAEDRVQGAYKRVSMSEVETLDPNYYAAASAIMAAAKVAPELQKFFDTAGNVVMWAKDGVNYIAQEFVEGIYNIARDMGFYKTGTVSENVSVYDGSFFYDSYVNGNGCKITGNVHLNTGYHCVLTIRLAADKVNYTVSNFISDVYKVVLIRTTDSMGEILKVYRYNSTNDNLSYWNSVLQFYVINENNFTTWSQLRSRNVTSWSLNIPIFSSESNALDFCRTGNLENVLNPGVAEEENPFYVHPSVANPAADKTFADLFEKWLPRGRSISIDERANYPNAKTKDGEVAVLGGTDVQALPLDYPLTATDTQAMTKDDQFPRGEDDDEKKRFIGGVVMVFPSVDNDPMTDTQDGTIEDPIPDDMTNTLPRVIEREKEKQKEKENTQTIEETKTIAGQIVDWGLGYISPSTGILSKFPFSIPYDLYLIVGAFSGEAEDPTFMDPKNLGVVDDLNAPGAQYETYTEKSPLSWNETLTIGIDTHLGDSGGEQMMVDIPVNIDLSGFSWMFRLIRVFVGILWLVGLLNWARKETN